MDISVKETKVHMEKVADILFYLAYGIELGMLLIDKSALINPFEGRLFQVTFVLCFFKVLLTKYNTKEWVLIGSFCLLGAVSYFATERNEIIRVVMFVAASKGINIKKMMKCTFYVTLVGVLCMMLLSAGGILGWNYVESDFDGEGPGGIIRRYCFGLGHPNAFHCMMWSLILLVMYLWFEKLRWFHLAMIGVLNMIAGYFTQSRAGMLIVFGSLFLFCILKYCNTLKQKKWLYDFSICGIWGMVAFCVIDAKFGWQIPVIKTLDRFFTNRFGLAARYGGLDTWSFFSQAANQEYFDVGYIRLFYWYGIIPALVYLIVVCLFIRYCYRQKAYDIFLVVMMFSIYTLVEAHAISVYIARNYIILLLFMTWPQVFNVSGGQEFLFFKLGSKLIEWLKKGKRYAKDR